MIGKKKSEDQSGKQSINLINEGTRIQGDLVSSGDVRIDGFLKGEINTGSRLAVGLSGQVEGRVHCAYADIAGQIEGDMVVTESLTIRATAKIHGDLTVGKLIVEEGALFTGNCTMVDMQSVANRHEKTLAQAE
ncbi:MAG: polymer-forming cytoskeletal protein [Bacteroidia bacterium]|jgi:cytoskeletal protein CcmA (bactofilin family)